jgi:hypothetical protein
MPSCPRCGTRNTLIPERDRYGPYASCWVCGYVAEEPQASCPLEYVLEDGMSRRREPSIGGGGRGVKVKVRL